MEDFELFTCHNISVIQKSLIRHIAYCCANMHLHVQLNCGGQECYLYRVINNRIFSMTHCGENADTTSCQLLKFYCVVLWFLEP